jgi:hypothetical protein
MGQDIGRGVYDAKEFLFRGPTDPLERNVASTGDEDLDALYDTANKTPEGGWAHLAGGLNTAIGLGGVSAPGRAAQGTLGALTGALTSGGASDYDPLATGIGTVVGGGLGALGGYVGNKAQEVREWLRGGTNTVTNASKLAGDKTIPLGERLLDMRTSGKNPLTEATWMAGTKAAEGLSNPKIYQAGGQTLASGIGTGAGVARAQDAQMLDELAGEDEIKPELGELSFLNRAPGMTAEDQEQADNYSRLFFDDEANQIANAERVEMPPAPNEGQPVLPWNETTLRKPDDLYTGPMDTVDLKKPSDWTADIGDAQIKAYAGLPALSYSMHTVLSSGDHGLPDKARNELTQALLRGNQDKIRSVNFKLQDRYPEYQKRLQETLDELNAEM